MKYLYAILIVLVLVGLYVVLASANKKTPVPEGCENLEPNCGACGLKDCAMRIKSKEEKNG